MENSSEYQIPIFISSTHYNLIDLRAELSRFLNEIGYRPILSSSDGFPDSSPKLEPWESCLPVLDRTFITILIVDGKYGAKLKWPNFEEIIEKREISPTHAEYVFSHKTHKRILVFIRRELMAYYQMFRSAFKKYSTEAERKRALTDILPSYIDYETLEFINEIKVKRPITWIKEFDDVTQMKREVQRKLINELAEVFLLKEKRIENVVDIFNRTVDELSPTQQKEILKKITATKEITKENEKLKKLNTDLKKARKEKKTAKVKALEGEIEKLNKAIKVKSSADTGLVFNNQGKLRINTYDMGISGAFSSPITGSLLTSPTASSMLFTKNCDKCGKAIKQELFSVSGGLRKCYSCQRNLCNDCWPMSSFLGTCPDCFNKPFTATTLK